jgi:hypothetical protein
LSAAAIRLSTAAIRSSVQTFWSWRRVAARQTSAASVKDTQKPPVYPLICELIGWTLGRTADLPKSHRFTFGQRLDNLSLDLLLLIVRALYSDRPAKLPLLDEANLLLEQLRVLWRLVHDQHWISQQQLLFVNAKIDEIGRMLGGWRRSLSPAQKNRP